MRAQAARAAVGDVTGGAILRIPASERWAFLLPDVHQAGADVAGCRWRVQYFDDRGFSGHSLYPGVEAALDAAMAACFTKRDDGALDRMQRCPSFWRGNYAADLIQRVNCRELTHDQAVALMAEYDRHPLLA